MKTKKKPTICKDCNRQLSNNESHVYSRNFPSPICEDCFDRRSKLLNIDEAISEEVEKANRRLANHPTRFNEGD